MAQHLFRRPVIAILAVAITALGGVIAGSGVVSAASSGARPDTSYCQTKTDFSSCISASGSTVTGTGSADGICAIYPAHEELSYPGGSFNTPDHSHWCGSPKLSLGADAGSGEYCATLWEGPESNGSYIALAKICHSFN